MFRLALSVLGVLIATSQAFSQDSWIGKQIVIKSSGVPFGPTETAGPIVPIPLDEVGYVVKAEQNGLILVSTPQGLVGWLDKTKAIPLDEAVDYFTTVLRNNPKDADALCRRGGTWFLLEKPDSAINDLNAAIEIDPKQAVSYVNRGHAWVQKKTYDKAIADYQKALTLDSKNLRAHTSLANAWMLTKELDKAIEEFGKVLGIVPDSWNIYNFRGQLYFAKKQPDKAVADFTEVIRLNPRDPTGLCNRGMTLAAMKSFDAAIADYDQVLRIWPRLYHAFLGRALVWYAMQEYEKTVSDLEEVLKIDPKNVDAYNQLAWVWATCPNEKLRDGARALDTAKQAFAITKEGRTMDTLAAAYAETGDFDQAITWQQQAMQDPAFMSGFGERARVRLELYRKKMPFRDVPVKAAGSK